MRKIVTFFVFAVLGITALNAQTIVEAETANTLTGKIKVNGDVLDGIKVEDAGVLTTATYDQVDFAEAGTFEFRFLTSGFNSATRIVLDIDGTVAGYTNLKNTGGWGDYLLSDSIPVAVTAGSHAIKLTFSHDFQYDDLDSTEFTGYICNFDNFQYEKQAIHASVKTSLSNAVNVYPIPAAGVLNVELNEKAHLSIYTMAGTQIYSGVNTGVKTSIDVTDFASGFYLLKVEKASGSFTKRIVVE